MSGGNGENQPSFRTTAYFDSTVRGRHPESNRFEWVQHVLDHYTERRRDDQYPERIRFYGYIREADKYMRVVVMPDGIVHNAFFDRNYGQEQRRRSLRGET